MLTALCISIFSLAFVCLAWRRFTPALATLFLLLPAYLIRFHIGPLPTTLLEVMLWTLVAVWLTKAGLRGDCGEIKALFIKKHRTLAIAIALFLLGAAVGVAASANLRAALGEWKAFYLEPILLFVVLATTLNKPTASENAQQSFLSSPVNQIIFALVLSGLATSALAIYQRFTGWLVPYSFWENRNTYRVTAWYGFPNAVGLFLAPLLPLALYILRGLWLERRKNVNQHLKNRADKIPNSKLTALNSLLVALTALFLPASLVAIGFAKSTGGLVGSAAGLGILLLFFKKTRWPAVAVGLFSLVALVLTPGSNPIKQELILQDRSGRLRLDMWAETSALLMKRPVTGAGLASYSKLIYPYRIDKRIEVFHHPHNIFLTMWVNIGLIGLFGFVWVLVWFYRTGFTAIRLQMPAGSGFRRQAGDLRHETSPPIITPFLLSTMTVWVVMGLVDSPYIKNDLAVVFWLMPALMIAATAPKLKQF